LLVDDVKEKPTRVQFELDPHAFEELLKLQESLGASSYAEVFRRSLGSLARIIETRDKGGTILSRDANGTETELWVI
jgi:hypothetical protein